MHLTDGSIKSFINKVISGHTIDISGVTFIDPWCMVLLCLLLAKNSEFEDKNIILPNEDDLLTYLKRMHLSDILDKFGYNNAVTSLEPIRISEHPTLNVQEIIHCEFSDEFNSKLEHFLKMFNNFGLSVEDSKLATGLIAELGNNVFDHNLGTWPTSTVGCFIVGQNWPKTKRIHVAVGDVGVGFMGSLVTAFPELRSDEEAILKGLAGFTGRVGEKRGNGLKLIQEWTIKRFSGELLIHSGNGIAKVDKKGISSHGTFDLLGTIAQVVLYYE